MGLGTNELKKDFLIKQSIANSIGGAFQHAGVYDKGLAENDPRKVALRKTLTKELEALGKSYTKSISDEAHCQNIIALAETLRCEHADILKDRQFRIGVAQKALNLYLKYMWCLGHIATPPHCPIDRRIINKLDLHWKELPDHDWTKLKDIEKYKVLIQKCRDKAGSSTVAEWELGEWTF